MDTDDEIKDQRLFPATINAPVCTKCGWRSIETSPGRWECKNANCPESAETPPDVDGPGDFAGILMAMVAMIFFFVLGLALESMKLKAESKWPIALALALLVAIIIWIVATTPKGDK